MRPTKLPWVKVLLATMPFEWRCEASDRRPLVFSFFRPWLRRCWFSRQIVACFTVCMLVVAGSALAPAQEPAEAVAGAVSARALMAARGATARRARPRRRRGCFRGVVMGGRGSFRGGGAGGVGPRAGG